jgi:hypothetical protein
MPYINTLVFTTGLFAWMLRTTDGPFIIKGRTVVVMDGQR